MDRQGAATVGASNSTCLPGLERIHWHPPPGKMPLFFNRTLERWFQRSGGERFLPTVLSAGGDGKGGSGDGSRQGLGLDGTRPGRGRITPDRGPVRQVAWPAFFRGSWRPYRLPVGREAVSAAHRVARPAAVVCSWRSGGRTARSAATQMVLDCPPSAFAFSEAPETLAAQRFPGGRYWDRTTDRSRSATSAV